MNKKLAVTVYAICALSAPVALFLASGCGPKSEAAKTPIAVTPAVAKVEFVGNDACKECHGKACDMHQKSNHNFTMNVADRKTLEKLFPKSGPIRKTPYSVKEDPEHIVFTRTGQQPANITADYVLGSGHAGMTSFAITKPDHITEFRMSYFPRTGQWYVTPGQEAVGNDDLGMEHDTSLSRKCILCHATNLPDNSLKAEPKFFGVGCESCHGPGSAHIEAAKTKGATDLKVEKLHGLSGDKMNDLCGKCHRKAADVSITGPDSTATHRFQPFGLQQSPCFEKSHGKLTCITCHDPHTNAEKNPKFYESICLSCHKPAGSIALDPIAVKRVDPVISKICPVNSKDKCVTCHMPKRKVFPFSPVPMEMNDHLIWSYGKKKHA
ncbi:MAG: multiheme c-type cytochrome [Chthonomonadales bacterium]